MTYDFTACEVLIKDLKLDLEAIRKLFISIKDKLQKYADGKTLKGDEIVAWLGEIYCRLISNGKLVSDDLEYDVLSPTGERISVKTRKGENIGWSKTSAIPKIEMDDDSPTHLMFIHLYDNYSIKEIWLFPWEDLLQSGRFRAHNVRDNRRSYQVRINRSTDKKYLIYHK